MSEGGTATAGTSGPELAAQQQIGMPSLVRRPAGAALGWVIWAWAVTTVGFYQAAVL
jgi:hypothetical protein